jgi:hypothetical protein
MLTQALMKRCPLHTPSNLPTSPNLINTSIHPLSTTAIVGNEARRILDTYADKIQHKARKEDLSVNRLIQQSVPRDEVAHVRRVEGQVANWRRQHRSSKGTSFFVQVPWLADKKKSGENKE